MFDIHQPEPCIGGIEKKKGMLKEAESGLGVLV